MAYKTWKDLGFRIRLTSVLKDLTAYTNQAGLNTAIKAIEATAFSDANPVFIPGLARPSIDVNGYWNTTVESVFGPCLDGTGSLRTVEFRSYTGRYYNGSCLPTSIKLSGKVEDMQLWSATLIFSGAFNRTSVALT